MIKSSKFKTVEYARKQASTRKRNQPPSPESGMGIPSGSERE